MRTLILLFALFMLFGGCEPPGSPKQLLPQNALTIQEKQIEWQRTMKRQGGIVVD